MLNDLAKRLGAGLVSAVMIAVAAGITLVAAAFAAYAGFKTMVGPAAASALTALVFAAVAGLVAVLAPKVMGAKPKPHAHPAHRPVDPETWRTISQVGAAILGLVGDIALSRRLKRQQKAKHAKSHRRSSRWSAGRHD